MPAESRAIAKYIAEKYEDKCATLLGQTPKERAVINMDGIRSPQRAPCCGTRDPGALPLQGTQETCEWGDSGPSLGQPQHRHGRVRGSSLQDQEQVPGWWELHPCGRLPHPRHAVGDHRSGVQGSAWQPPPRCSLDCRHHLSPSIPEMLAGRLGQGHPIPGVKELVKLQTVKPLSGGRGLGDGVR